MNRVNKKEATIKAILYTHYTSSINSHPVRIRVAWNRAIRYYPVKMDGEKLFLTSSQWQEIHDNPDLKKNKKILDPIADAETQAREAKKQATKHDAKPFLFSEFEKYFLQQESDRGILSIFEKYLKDLKAAGRIGSYSSYKNAYMAFNEFRGGNAKTKKIEFKRGKDIMPEEVNVELLKKFDSFLKERGCNKTTVGIYMRSIKAVYNLAADDNPALLESYPFARKQTDRNRYKIRKGSGKKGQALSIDELQSLINTTPLEGSPEWEAKQYWLFMFYGQGMNMADVVNLRYRDIKEDAIRYVRKKTEDTELNEEQVVIPLSVNLKTIIVSIGNPDKSPDAYVFPILSENMDIEKIHSVKKQKTKTINKWLRRLCDDAKLPPITTYWSRHSYASILRGLAVSDELISELLGHGDVRTTKTYLQRFDIKKRREANEKVEEAILKKAS